MINDEYILSERDVELIKLALEKTISITIKEDATESNNTLVKEMESLLLGL